MQTIAPILSTGSNEALKSAVCADLGIVYSFKPVFNDLVNEGKVVEIMKPYTRHSGLNLVALIPEQRQLPLRISRFLEVLREGSWRNRTQI